jgi:AraC family transcriptional regulator
MNKTVSYFLSFHRETTQSRNIEQTERRSSGRPPAPAHPPPRQPARGRDGTLPRAKLRAVVEPVEKHLEASLTLEPLAAVAHLSVYHLARQFQAATGLPPHQYVILRRVERARQLLQAGTGLSLAVVALHAGFSDQSAFCHHFKRLVGLTLGRFRTPA